MLTPSLPRRPRSLAGVALLAGVVALALAILPRAVHAQFGAHCTREEGHGAILWGPSYYFTDKTYDSLGTRRFIARKGRFAKAQLNALVEYGYTPTTTVVANLAVARLESSDSTFRVNSVGLVNPEIGITRSLNTYPVLRWLFCAAKLTVKLPFHGYGDPLIGFDQADVEAGLRSAGSWGPEGQDGFVVLDGGYRWRFDEPADEIRASGQAAFRIGGNAFLSGALFTTTGMKNGQRLSIPNTNVTLNPDYSSYAVQGGLLFKLADGNAIHLTVGGEFAGRNAGSGLTFGVTFWQGF